MVWNTGTKSPELSSIIVIMYSAGSRICVADKLELSTPLTELIEIGMLPTMCKAYLIGLCLILIEKGHLLNGRTDH